MKQLLEFLRAGSETERFHSVRTINRETVGHHSFNVAWLCWVLSDGGPRVELIMAALQHDLAEHVTGDIPSPTKRVLDIRTAVAELEQEVLADGGLPEITLTAEETRVLNLADAMDGMLACQRERAMGNKLVVPIFEKCQSCINADVHTDIEIGIFRAIREMWREVHDC